MTRQLLAALGACAAPLRRLARRRTAARRARIAARALEQLPAATLRDIGLRWDEIPLAATRLEDTRAGTAPREDTADELAVTEPARS